MISNMTGSEGSNLYPLTQVTKAAAAQQYRRKYINFWELLSDKLDSSEDEFVASKQCLSILKIISDQLVSLSSMGVVNVRDAVVEVLCV